MKQETYTEIEKIIVKGAKDDYFFFDVMCGVVGILLVYMLVSNWGNVPMMMLVSVGIIVFAIVYIPYDAKMQDKLKARQQLADEIKKDVKG
jgi:hypothetical protein